MYLEEVENRRIDGKVRQVFLRHLGKEVNGDLKINIDLDSLDVESVKINGKLQVLDWVATELGLKDLLGEYSQEILSIVYSRFLGESGIKKLEDWYQKTDLNVILNLESLTERRLQSALDHLSSLDQDLLFKSLHNNARKQFSLGDGGVIYDVTNTHVTGKKCAFAKHGKDKRGVHNSQIIQYALGVTRGEGFPVFCEIYEGNISDTKTFNSLIEHFRTIGSNHGLVVFDRGITSKAHIIQLKKLGWGSLCGVKSNPNLVKIVKETIDFQKLIHPNNYHVIANAGFYVRKIGYTIGSKGWLYICCDNRKRTQRMSEFHKTLVEAKAQLDSGKSVAKELEKYFTKKNNLRKNTIEETELMNGISFVFSRQNEPIDAVLKIYFTDKDIVEKAFELSKGLLNLRPIGHWLKSRVQARFLICYLSYSIASVLRLKWKKIDCTLEGGLSELDNLYTVYMRDRKKLFHFSKTVCFNKKQEKLMKCIHPSITKKYLKNHDYIVS